MKSKGFMMTEVIVVSAIALVGLATLYTSYNKIYSKYLQRLSYNDMKALNRVIFYRDFLIEDCDAIYENCKINTLINNAKNNSNKKLQKVSVNLVEANNDVGDDGPLKSETVFIYYNQKNNFNDSIFNGVSVNQTFKDYVNYLNTSVKFNKANFVLLIERCPKKKKDTDKDDCKYAYLDVYDR